jgi:hypothetical protein
LAEAGRAIRGASLFFNGTAENFFLAMANSPYGSTRIRASRTKWNAQNIPNEEKVEERPGLMDHVGEWRVASPATLASRHLADAVCALPHIHGRGSASPPGSAGRVSGGSRVPYDGLKGLVDGAGITEGSVWR